LQGEYLLTTTQLSLIKSKRRERAMNQRFTSVLEFRTPYFLIKGGSFVCSVANTEEHVKDIYFSQTLVTNECYREFIKYLEGGSLYEKHLPLAEFRDELKYLAASDFWKWEKVVTCLKNDRGDLAALFKSSYDKDPNFSGDRQPVVGISWYAANAYCLWLSLLESEGECRGGYRLPSEIEWEYAAGGKNKRKYPWPKKKGEPTPKLANYGKNKEATSEVRFYWEGTTPERLYDMAGNVWEWMENWFDKDETTRALRGGSWNNSAKQLLCTSRSFSLPYSVSNLVGFRVIHGRNVK